MEEGIPKAPRVCMLLESYCPVVGGMETQARNLSISLAAAGVPVLIVTRRSNPDLPETEVLDGIRVCRVPPTSHANRARWFTVATCLPTLIRRRRDYDIILVPGFRALGISAVIAGKFLGKRVVLKAENNGEMSGEFFEGGLKRMNLTRASPAVRVFLALRNRLFVRADAFVSMSSKLTAEFVGQGVPPGRITMIPQTVDVSRFHPVDAEQKAAYRRELGLPADDLLAIYTGRLVSYKGVPLLLEAWENVCRTFKDAKLLVVGEGGVDIYNCEAELRNFVESHHLQDNVMFTGARRNVDEYLKACDFLVFPTRNEAFGISLIEAMACGLPSISTNEGGIRDILDHERNGLMIEVGDSRQIEEAVVRMLRDPALRRSLGEAAHRTVMERYTRQIVTRQYVDLFNACLARKPSASPHQPRR